MLIRSGALATPQAERIALVLVTRHFVRKKIIFLGYPPSALCQCLKTLVQLACFGYGQPQDAVRSGDTRQFIAQWKIRSANVTILCAFI